MANQTLPQNLTGLSRKLVELNLIDEKAAIAALAQSQKQKIQFVTYVVENKLVSPKMIAIIAANEFGIALFNPESIDLEQIPKNIVTEKLIRTHHAIPIFKRGKRLFVAVSDPTNLLALDEFKFHTGISTESVIVEEDKLSALIEKVLTENEESSLGNLEDTDLDSLDFSNPDDEDAEASAGGAPLSEADEAPIVRFVNKILLDAINGGASDIHFEPYEKIYRIRFRQDGILREIAHPPTNLAPRLSARLKVMSRLDISERRIPQDGRFKMKISKNRAIDFRVSTCPTLFGEKVVMRILDPSSATLGIEHLGYEEDQRRLFLEAIEKPQGMVLVTGPTGSGKTVSLYTALHILNTPEINISTAEDPVEINIAGLNQVNVNPKAGLSFAAALRSFLRQDPDVVMVGEIRDLETAEIAVKAAQTGHMVLSTLHTNSAPETVTRMMNMGIPGYNLATSLNLIVAQRLARRLCTHCKAKMDIPEHALLEFGFKQDEIGSFDVYKPVGCDKCVEGYKGRLGLYEVMPMTDAIGRIIMSGGNSMEIADQAIKEGMVNLRRSGLNKVKAGLTSLEEVNRVTKE